MIFSKSLASANEYLASAQARLQAFDWVRLNYYELTSIVERLLDRYHGQMGSSFFMWHMCIQDKVRDLHEIQTPESLLLTVSLSWEENGSLGKSCSTNYGRDILAKSRRRI